MTSVYTKEQLRQEIFDLIEKTSDLDKPDTELVKLVIKYYRFDEIPVDSKDVYTNNTKYYFYPGDTNALMIASAKGDLELVKLLVKKGANVNENISIDKDINSFTPICYAFWENQFEVLKFLYENGAKVFERMYPHNIDIMSNAIRNGNMNVYNYLYEKGERLQLTSLLDVFERLEGLPGSESKDKIAKYIEEDLRVIKVFCENKPTPDFFEVHGEEILEYACYSKNKEAVNILINNGLDVNIFIKNNNLNKHIYTFFSGGYSSNGKEFSLEIPKLLIENGFIITKNDVENYSPGWTSHKYLVDNFDSLVSKS